MKRILIFDLETTGLDTSKDRIVQFAATILSNDGANPIAYNQYFNPGFPIPSESTAIHGITDEMVKDMPDFGEHAQRLHELMMDPETILAGYNIMGFDFKMLQTEFTRYGLPFSLVGREVLEIGNLVKILYPRTLEAMFNNVVGSSIKEVYGDAHNAYNDTLATRDLFTHIVGGLIGGDIPLDYVKDEVPQLDPKKSIIEFAVGLAKFSRYGNHILDIDGKFKDRDGKIVWGFGKYLGEEVNTENYDHVGFLQWMLSKDFKPDTLELARSLLANR